MIMICSHVFKYALNFMNYCYPKDIHLYWRSEAQSYVYVDFDSKRCLPRMRIFRLVVAVAL